GFFFSSRRRHTRSKRDWSSDVCSSDLMDFRARIVGDTGHTRRAQNEPREAKAFHQPDPARDGLTNEGRDHFAALGEAARGIEVKIGRASWRERVRRWVVGGGWREKQRE